MSSQRLDGKRLYWACSVGRHNAEVGCWNVCKEEEEEEENFLSLAQGHDIHPWPPYLLLQEDSSRVAARVIMRQVYTSLRWRNRLRHVPPTPPSSPTFFKAHLIAALSADCSSEKKKKKECKQAQPSLTMKYARKECRSHSISAARIP